MAPSLSIYYEPGTKSGACNTQTRTPAPVEHAFKWAWSAESKEVAIIMRNTTTKAGRGKRAMGGSCHLKTDSEKQENSSVEVWQVRSNPSPGRVLGT